MWRGTGEKTTWSIGKQRKWDWSRNLGIYSTCFCLQCRLVPQQGKPSGCKFPINGSLFRLWKFFLNGIDGCLLRNISSTARFQVLRDHDRLQWRTARQFLSITIPQPSPCLPPILCLLKKPWEPKRAMPNFWCLYFCPYFFDTWYIFGELNWKQLLTWERAQGKEEWKREWIGWVCFQCVTDEKCLQCHC